MQSYGFYFLIFPWIKFLFVTLFSEYLNFATFSRTIRLHGYKGRVKLVVCGLESNLVTVFSNSFIFVYKLRGLLAIDWFTLLMHIDLFKCVTAKKAKWRKC
jgi:hypothetical protein